jgi:hypothetical protein
MEEQIMKKLLGGLGLLTLMAFSVFAVPSQADTAAAKKVTITPGFRYDVSKEITLKGTISSVVAKPGAGMLPGKHLMLATSSGTVDAHIGSYAGRDKRLDSLAEGQAVSAVGMKITIHGKEVFIVRTIQSGDDTYTVRNTKGFFSGLPAPRYRATSSTKEGVR